MKKFLILFCLLFISCNKQLDTTPKRDLYYTLSIHFTENIFLQEKTSSVEKILNFFKLPKDLSYTTRIIDPNLIEIAFHKGLKPDTTYQLTLIQNLPNNIAFTKDHTYLLNKPFSFTPFPLKINVNFYSLKEKGFITLSSNLDLDLSSIKENIKILDKAKKNINYHIKKETNQKFKIYPKNLTKDQNYTLIIFKNLHSQNGNTGLKENIEKTFESKTSLSLLKLENLNKSTLFEEKEPLYVLFNNTLALKQDLNKLIHITPFVENISYQIEGNKIKINGDFLKDTLYHFSFSKKIKDIYQEKLSQNLNFDIHFTKHEDMIQNYSPFFIEPFKKTYLPLEKAFGNEFYLTYLNYSNLEMIGRYLSLTPEEQKKVFEKAKKTIKILNPQIKNSKLFLDPNVFPKSSYLIYMLDTNEIFKDKYPSEILFSPLELNIHSNDQETLFFTRNILKNMSDFDVDIYAFYENKLHFLGNSGKNGFLHYNKKLPENSIFLAQKNNFLTFNDKRYSLSYGNIKPHIKSYLFSDRELYNNTDTIHIKGLIRKKNGSSLNGIKDKIYTFKLKDSRYKIIQEKKVKSNNFGNIKWNIAPLDYGYYTLYLYQDTYMLDSLSFDVKDYEKQKIFFDLLPRSNTNFSEPFSLDIKMFTRNKEKISIPIDLNIFFQSLVYQNPLYPDYDFEGEINYNPYYTKDIYQNTLTKEKTSFFIYSSHLNQYGKLNFHFKSKENSPYLVDYQNSLTISPSYFLGIKMSPIYLIGTKQLISILVLNSKEEKENTKLSIKVLKYPDNTPFFPGRDLKDLKTSLIYQKIISTKDSFDLNLSKNGMYLIKIKKGENTLVKKVQILDPKDLDQTLEIQTKQENSKLWIQNPFPEKSQGVLIYFQDNILKYENFYLEKNEHKIFEIPIFQNKENIYADIYITSSYKLENQNRAFSSILLDSKISRHKLYIHLKNKKEFYAPNEKVSLKLDVFNYKKEKSESELTIWAVDQQSANWHTKTLENPYKFFYQNSSGNASFYTFSPFLDKKEMLFPVPYLRTANMMFDKVMANSISNIRSDFSQTAFYISDFHYDPNKKENTISFTLPDNITKYKLFVIADNKDSFTMLKDSFFVKKDFFLDTNIPSFVRKKDALSFSTQIHNTSTQNENLTFKININGKEKKKNIISKKNSKQTVDFSYTVEDEKDLLITLSLYKKTLLVDQLRYHIPVFENKKYTLHTRFLHSWKGKDSYTLFIPQKSKLEILHTSNLLPSHKEIEKLLQINSFESDFKNLLLYKLTQNPLYKEKLLKHFKESSFYNPYTQKKDFYMNTYALLILNDPKLISSLLEENKNFYYDFSNWTKENSTLLSLISLSINRFENIDHKTIFALSNIDKNNMLSQILLSNLENISFSFDIFAKILKEESLNAFFKPKTESIDTLSFNAILLYTLLNNNITTYPIDKITHYISENLDETNLKSLFWTILIAEKNTLSNQSFCILDLNKHKTYQSTNNLILINYLNEKDKNTYRFKTDNTKTIYSFYHFTSFEDEPKNLTNGFSLEKSFLSSKNQMKKTFKKGDKIQVELSIYTPFPRKEVLLYDPIPSGSKIVQDLSSSHKYHKGKKDHIEIYIPKLETGTTKVKYTLYLTNKGEYKLPYSYIYEMFSNENYGFFKNKDFIIQ